MANIAAILPVVKAPLEIQEVEIYDPGPHELLVKNELIAFNPFEAKLARIGRFPVQYPIVSGGSFGETIKNVGSGVTDFKVGDKVAVALQNFREFSNRLDSTDLKILTTLISNMTTIVGLFNGRAGFKKPDLDSLVVTKDKKILVYGGSSSVGSLFYITQAGYAVITTNSPRNTAFVSKLGSGKVIDHNQDQSDFTRGLIAEGPHDLVIDSISLQDTVAETAAVVATQGGGTLYTLPSAAVGPDNVPEGVTCKFQSWPSVLDEEKNAGMLHWTLKYFPQAISKQKLTPLPAEIISGGLKGVDVALDRLHAGVSGVKLIADPWESIENHGYQIEI